MLELVSINVTNFRSFSEGELVPLGMGQGMTAINGTNGKGKSSLVHALVWALYGVTPDGVPVRALRRQGSEGDVIAAIVFRHDGQTIEVTRALRGRNDTTIASIKVDGIEQTNVSAKTATLWVQNRLNLDSEAFLTAFVVRQKELDSLVKARPADRRKTIERLAGIERMSGALDLARQESRGAQRVLDALPMTEDPEVAAQAVEDAEKTFAAAESAADDTRIVYESARDEAAAADSAVRVARVNIDTVRSAQNQVSLIEQRLENAEDKVTSLKEQARGAESLTDAQSAAEQARSARAAAEQALAGVAQVAARAATEQARLEDIEADAARAAGALTTAQARLTATEAANTFPADLEEQIALANAAVDQIGTDRGAARGEWDRLRKAIDALKMASESHTAECPTCSHPLADADGLIELQEKMLEDVRRRGSELSAAYDQTVAKAAELTQQRADAQSAALRVEAAQQAVTDAQAALARMTTAVAKAVDAAESAAEEAHEAQANAAAATRDLPTLRDAETSAQAALRQAENAAAAARDLVTAQSALEVLAGEYATAEQALKDAEALVAGVQIDTLEGASKAAQAAAATATEQAQDARTRLTLAQRDVVDAQAAHARAVAAAATRKKALADVEKTSAVASAMEEFRRDRLSRLAPELSEVASDFVARMTEGRYTAVELDEEFTPVLTDASGDQRPVAWLSGGEESAVALALRIAIGEVLAGQRGGLLILDEVLTAQDTSRRQATMAAIRVLPRQVITINHVSEASDMVDLVAEVVDDGEGASTVVAYAPEHAVSNDLSDAMVDA